MNKTIETILNRRSNRTFDIDAEIPQSDIELMVESYRYSPTWINGAQNSLIIVKDKSIINELYILSGKQEHIKKAKLIAIPIADFKFIDKIMKETKTVYKDDNHKLFICTVDASLAAQNMIIAATSLGIKSVVVGHVRNNVYKLKKLLELPEYTFPLFAIAFGYSSKEVENKPPKISKEARIFENKYNESLLTNESLLEVDKYLIKNRTMNYKEYVSNFYGTKMSKSYQDDIVEAFKNSSK